MWKIFSKIDTVLGVPQVAMSKVRSTEYVKLIPKDNVLNKTTEENRKQLKIDWFAVSWR